VILVWGTSTDPPTAAILAALARHGAETFFLDQTAWRDIAFDGPALDRGLLEGRICQHRESLDLADVTAAYIRPVDLARLPGGDVATDAERRRHALATAGIVAWADAASGVILNRPASMASNNAKPYQAALIHAQGFAVPESLITSDPAALRDFLARHEALIYKSTSGVRSIVTRYDPRDRSRRVDDAACPTMFQRWIPGTDVRVHVVGQEVFAVQVTSTATDYRYPASEAERPLLSAVSLPDPVARRCADLAAALDLPFAGIDLRRSDDGVWFCFEANPSPAFTYYEEATGVPIAASVAALLCGG
jgi:glutathione synthase/RimK-type ligase-like ATP-grasp enzyme